MKKEVRRRKRMSNESLLILFLTLLAVMISLIVFSWNIMIIKRDRIEIKEAMGGGTDKLDRLDRQDTEEAVEENTETLEEIIKDRVPVLYQWDERWKDYTYGSGPMEVTGCGPTCLSMVAMYLLKSTEFTPIWMADFSAENGFCVPGSGTSWSFMSEGAALLGIDGRETAPNKTVIKESLLAGNPIICIMGPGIFTDGGHFIVLTDWVDGQVKINDPNSVEHTEMLWKYEELESQMRSMWVYQR